MIACAEKKIALGLKVFNELSVAYQLSIEKRSPNYFLLNRLTFLTNGEGTQQQSRRRLVAGYWVVMLYCTSKNAMLHRQGALYVPGSR
jgi:hypothetical protein